MDQGNVITSVLPCAPHLHALSEACHIRPTRRDSTYRVDRVDNGELSETAREECHPSNVCSDDDSPVEDLKAVVRGSIKDVRKEEEVVEARRRILRGRAPAHQDNDNTLL